MPSSSFFPSPTEPPLMICQIKLLNGMDHLLVMLSKWLLAPSILLLCYKTYTVSSCASTLHNVLALMLQIQPFTRLRISP